MYVYIDLCMCVCCVTNSNILVGPYEELIAADGIVEEYFAFDATSVDHNNLAITNATTYLLQR